MVGFWDNQAPSSKSHFINRKLGVVERGLIMNNRRCSSNPYHLGDSRDLKAPYQELGTDIYFLLYHTCKSIEESWHFVLGCSVWQSMNMVCMLMIFFISVLSFSAQKSYKFLLDLYLTKMTMTMLHFKFWNQCALW